MNVQRLSRTGFTLPELVIVITLLGVIALVAAPRMSRASGAAGATLDANLTLLRNAIDLYAAQHDGAFPGNTPGVSLEDQLTSPSNASGHIGAAHSAAYPYGPYLQQIPAVPLGLGKGSSGIHVVLTTPTSEVNKRSVGWIYNRNTGEIWVNASSYFDR